MGAQHTGGNAMTSPTPELPSGRFLLARIVESCRSRLRRIRPVVPPAEPITFCLAHYHAPQFLEVTLHAIRRHHAGARIIVADSRSIWPQYAAAREVCRRFSAEPHFLLAKHRHTGLLNYMFRQIRTDAGVFLDQDCVLLESLHPLLARLKQGVLLAGPWDLMRITHPNACREYPPFANHFFRNHPDYIHASLMVMDVRHLRHWIGRQPFRWDAAWGPHPLERYYGVTERVRQKQAQSIYALESQHTAYGLGMAYLHEGRPIAYHNWYSGQVFGQKSKMDGVFEADWLRSEMGRFIRDYWNNDLNLDLFRSEKGSIARS